jgi:hypothetical protein
MRKKRVIECNCNDIPPLAEQFQDIMNNFDFKHVQMMMNWDKARVIYDDDGNHMDYEQWKTLQGSYENYTLRVPTILELRKDAERLLQSAMRFAKANPRSRFYMTATGPFKVTYRYGILELECIFENWSCD